MTEPASVQRPSAGGELNALPQRSVQTFRTAAQPADHLTSFRRKRRVFRVVRLLVIVLLIAVGWLADKLEEQGAQRRQVEINTLLRTTDGILISDKGQVDLCDAACYNEIIKGEDDVDLINAILLASAEHHPTPPDLSLLAFTASNDDVPALVTLLGFLFLAILLSPLLLWKDPLRILLLRPFGEARVSRSLRRCIRRNASGCGHAITLADRYINESFIRNSTIYAFSPRRLIGQAFAIPLLPLVRLPPIVITIREEKHLSRVLEALNNRYNLNYYSIFDSIRKVRAANSVWQRVALLLMANTDVIVVDLTVVKEGSLWEIERLAADGLLSKCLFISEQGKTDGAAAVASVVGTHTPVFSYTKSGFMSEAERFERAMAEIASQGS